MTLPCCCAQLMRGSARQSSSVAIHFPGFLWYLEEPRCERQDTTVRNLDLRNCFSELNARYRALCIQPFYRDWSKPGEKGQSGTPDTCYRTALRNVNRSAICRTLISFSKPLGIIETLLTYMR